MGLARLDGSPLFRSAESPTLNGRPARGHPLPPAEAFRTFRARQLYVGRDDWLIEGQVLSADPRTLGGVTIWLHVNARGELRIWAPVVPSIEKDSLEELLALPPFNPSASLAHRALTENLVAALQKNGGSVSRTSAFDDLPDRYEPESSEESSARRAQDPDIEEHVSRLLLILRNQSEPAATAGARPSRLAERRVLVSQNREGQDQFGPALQRTTCFS